MRMPIPRITKGSSALMSGNATRFSRLLRPASKIAGLFQRYSPKPIPQKTRVLFGEPSSKSAQAASTLSRNACVVSSLVMFLRSKVLLYSYLVYFVKCLLNF